MFRNTRLVDTKEIKLPVQVATAMACVEASQHTAASSYGPFKYPVFSLHGQDGFSWLKNIVTNLRRDGASQFTVQGNLYFNLATWLDSLHIPFLVGINNHNQFPHQLSLNTATGVFAREFICGPDKGSLDGRFEFLQNGNLMECCAVEYNDESADLKTIFNKDINGRRLSCRIFEGKLSILPDLFLIFTNQLANPDELRTLCQMKRLTCIVSCHKAKLTSGPNWHLIRIGVFGHLLKV